MIYLYLDTASIKVLSLSKTLFGQYTVSYFQKKHTSKILEKGKVVTVDLVASAVKEALTMADPSKIKEKEVCLILPQESFEFARYEVPQDISETAIKPFIEDKVRAQSDFSLDDVLYDYVLIRQQQESNILFYAQRKEIYAQYYEALHLLGLSIEYLVPDTLCYFTLFAKTLRKDKRENILYVFYSDSSSYGYIYDSLGLLEKTHYHFHEPIETALHTTAATLSHRHIKLNRIIISGMQSAQIRQDTFTKKVGIWTNLLKKIIPTFYQEYLTLLSTTDKNFPLLDFDVCLGAFIAFCEHNVFSIKSMSKSMVRVRSPSMHKRDIIVFLASFFISFIIIVSFFRFGGLTLFSLKNVYEKPTIIPTSSLSSIPSSTPVPSIDRRALKIKVLNGGGIKGKAGEVKDILTEKGYGEILTGNADNFDYEKTEIQIVDDKKEVFSLLQKDLADYVTLDKTSSLDSDSSADIIIIVGKDFK